MKNTRISVSALLLLELICAVLIFSLSASVCVLAFTKSHKFSQSVDTLRNASFETSKAAELIRSCTTKEEVNDTLNENYKSGGDMNWTDLSADGEIRITLEEEEETMIHAVITYTSQNEEIDTLTIDHVVKAGENQ